MKEFCDQMSTVFDEWARRYAENPEQFDSILGPDGKPREAYGDHCVDTFWTIYDEIYPHELYQDRPVVVIGRNPVRDILILITLIVLLASLLNVVWVWVFG
ncbi:MAG: hypothetical protein KDG50_10225 [Chromatiales bacterium]|nr:hypothetical protein [Chromatiales bacterium]